MTSSLVAKMFRAVSLGSSSGRKMDNVAKGISAAAALKKLKGAALTTPVAVSCVVTQAIGRGIILPDKIYTLFLQITRYYCNES